MTMKTKDTARPAPPSQQVRALDEQIAELERDQADHTAAIATVLTERAAAEAKHAAEVRELEAAGMELQQHRAEHPPAADFYDAEGNRHVLKRPTTPGRDAALAEAEAAHLAHLDERLERECAARMRANGINLRIGAHQRALRGIDGQLGQLRAKREALLATHTGSGDAKSTLTRIRAGLAAMMQRPEEADIRKVRLTTTWWYTADRSRVVGDGDPAAASLLGRKGTAIEIDLHELERLGIRPGAAPATP